MAAYYQEEVKFYVSVDCIIFGFDKNELYVLLYKRTFEPLKGHWSLMGGFIKSGESVNDAASRVLTECTGIKDLFMEQVGAYGDVTRDIGERVISIAYFALVNMGCRSFLHHHCHYHRLLYLLLVITTRNISIRRQH